MKFGQVTNPEDVDFTLPDDHPDTKAVLASYKKDTPFEVYVGCAKWNRQDLKGFYPRGTKDELLYYASQFNSIELNATFYRSPDAEQVKLWRSKTPGDFRFYPKIPQLISHYKRLLGVKGPLMEFCDAISRFEEHLGISFLQLHDNFGPKNLDRLMEFVKGYPKGIPLAVELRNAAWFAGEKESEQLFELLRKEKKPAIIVDTAGRRDVLHMRLTSGAAFIRYVGANHPGDYIRLDDWLERIGTWRAQGLQSLHFFVHQNVEKESPLLSAYFIKKLNKKFKLKLKVPAAG
ncbi:MAG TPA: DUF72 domain-containing protein [Chitinophagaceae bacterium]|jgi:uncharacterized protein YecE (DUF72 family)|nr:DUF72 domain-containing protein [Chitinophagaceae bacterium]